MKDVPGSFEMKNILITFLALMGTVMSLFADISISDVEVFSGYPWQEVVIGYKITGSTDRTIGGLEVSAKDNVTGRVYECKTLDGVGFEPGRHVVKWNAAADGASFKSDDVAVTVRIVEPPQYCEIDLSCGTAASMYPVVELADAPSDGWTDEYKTAKLVLRRVDAGSFKMLGQYDVVLTKPFYIGVFEVTQYQWELVMGDRPSYFCNDSYYAARPVEQVSYDMIRGNSAGAGWPANNAVDVTSFLGRMRKRTGLDFDLPTEAEWEYACRAGTTTSFNNGADDVGVYQDSNMNILGRYWYNGGYEGERRPQSSDAAGTAKVGSYQPNAWGLYDMHGNVREWCRDWNGGVGSAVDPKGNGSGSDRVARGGAWIGGGCESTVNARGCTAPSNVSNYRGFRLALSLQVDGSPVRFDGNFSTIAVANSGSVAIDTTFTDGTGVGNSLSLAYGSVGGTVCRVLANGSEIVNSTERGNKVFGVPNSGANQFVYFGPVTMKSSVSSGYAIGFNANGGDTIPAIVSREEGSAYGTLPTIMRQGCEFLGWFNEPDGGKQVTANTIVDSSRTLYAHWERYAYDFKWLGGGKLDICAGTRRTDEAQGIAMDSAWGDGVRAVVSVDGVKTAESRGADEFVWRGDETKEYTLKHQVYDAQGRAVGEPYTSKIAWTSRAAVTFDGGNGEEAFSREYDKSYAYGELPSVTKTGHTFAGWYTAAEGGEKVEAGAQFDGRVSKLYAHWTVNQYGVKFDKNGGEGTAGDLTVAYGAVVPMEGVVFRKSGYRLAGWATAADGAAVYGQGGAMSNLTAEANGNVQLYAVWEPTTVDLKSFKQRYPWNGFVDVECEVGAEGRVGLTLIDEASGTNFTAKTLFCQGGSVTNSALWMVKGLQKFIWDAGSDLPDGFKTSKLKAKTYFVEGEE